MTLDLTPDELSTLKVLLTEQYDRLSGMIRAAKNDVPYGGFSSREGRYRHMQTVDNLEEEFAMVNDVLKKVEDQLK